MARLLLTGFAAFPGAPFNPSAEVVRRLARMQPFFARAGVHLSTAILPVVWDSAPARAAIARAAPDAIIHLGLAGRRMQVSLETRARNRASRLKPDARGRHAARDILYAGGPAHLPARWNAARLAAGLARQGIKAAPSRDAGDYICNMLLWTSLAAGAIPTLFIHIPRACRLSPARLALALARVAPYEAAHAIRDQKVRPFHHE